VYNGEGEKPHEERLNATQAARENKLENGCGSSGTTSE
jgi:hypothetical protein